MGVSFKVVKSGPYKDILAFDRELTEPEQTILQALIDTSYVQFVQTVAEARDLSVDTVKNFADGRVFTGQQALDLGLVDRLGTEADAQRWAAELSGLDPDKAKCYTFEEQKTFWNRFVPGNQQATFSLPPQILDGLNFELSTQGLPLWLYRP